MPVSTNIEPYDLGLPPKFAAWRPGQYQALMQGIESPARFVAHSMPTGGGKSLMYIAQAILSGVRTVVLTSTKGLQDQLISDFSECGLTDLRGRNNYSCSSTGGSCAEGRLLGCHDQQLCPHFKAREAFLPANLCVTNYSCYFSNVMHSEGVGDIGLLVIDEAHSAIEELSSALEIHLDHTKNNFVYRAINCELPPQDTSVSQWRNWAQKSLPKVKAYLTSIKKEGRHNAVSIIDALHGNLNRLTTIEKDWLVDDTYNHETVFSPLWPTDYAEQFLFRGIKKILLVSATIVPKTRQLLGIPEKDYLFVSHNATFNPARAPVYLFGASRIDHKSGEGAMQEMIGRMDTLISKRHDRKGVIHPVSYDRQNWIMSHSRHNGLMICPRGAALHDSLRLFRESDPPRILMSPAVTTGYDFPGRDAEYQIIVKVPFIDARSPITAARAKSDPEYLPYLTAQTLTQTCGRGMRSPQDQCESIILDKHANWFLRQKEVTSTGRNKGGFRHLFPTWFLNQVRYSDRQPIPPPALKS